ncbi:MAG TPA: hypothetical protein VK894_01575, partial [Jiangellales bacterium]|nr:hypothetical protein [Jiangellales bacterium]
MTSVSPCAQYVSSSPTTSAGRAPGPPRTFREAEQLLAASGEDTFGLRPAARVGWHEAVTDTERRAAAALAEALAQHDGELATLPGLALLAELHLACGQTDAAI